MDRRNCRVLPAAFSAIGAPTDAQIRIAHRALEQFSRVGTLAVGLIVLTGIINSLSLMGLPHPYALFASRYGQLLLIKLALFAAMLMLAGCQPLAADTRSWCSHRQRQSGPRVTRSSAKPGSGNVHSPYDPRLGGLAGYAGTDHGARMNYCLTLT
ncbi:MAG: CopD family protein [Sphingomonadales bacterium]|nr:CopD family protein [Sphingomonadales bacterium]